MHATVTGLRTSAHLFLIGVDKTNSIAIDEAFTKKPVIEGHARDTITLRTSSSRKTGSSK